MTEKTNVNIEYERLKELFKDISPGKMKVADGLIIQASRLRVLLDVAWDDIVSGGDYESFTQSEHTPAYERQRPVAKLFNQRDSAYQRVIAQLIGLLPKDKKEEDQEGFNAEDLI